MATLAAPTAHAGIGSGHSGGNAKESSAMNSSSNISSGFKVYGSLFKVDARYQFLNPLGKGSYGIVCAAKDRETGQSIAIKKVSSMAKRTVDAKHTLREVLLLQFLGKHPNIISIHNLSTNLRDDELYIVMDLMDTDMHRVIQSSQSLSESHVKYFLHQLLRGVKYLHDNGVLHRDLKPGNLLLSKTCQLKIADFGLARKLPKTLGAGSNSSTCSSGASERPRSAPAASSAPPRAFERAPMTEHVVTRWYRAPELMLQPDGLYDESVDMWSVGCIFAEILGRKALFPGKNFLHQLSLIFDVIGTPPPEATTRIKSSQAQRFLKNLGRKPKVPFRTLFPTASDDAIDLLDKLLEFDPAKRLSAHEALAHPYMQAIEKKYKGADPHPSLRVDFSFDSKKLTKMDLRALILKEVDTFRKSAAHTSATEDDLGEEDIRERSSSSSGSNQSAAIQSRKQQLRHDGLGKEKQHPLTGLAAASGVPGSNASSNNPFQSKVMCGSAGISMINSLLRQPSQNQDEQPGSLLPGTKHAVPSVTASMSAAAIGSNRQRIRTMTKPPVPRQQQVVPGGTLVSNQQLDHQGGRVTSHHNGSQLAALIAEEHDGQTSTPKSRNGSAATSATATLTTSRNSSSLTKTTTKLESSDEAVSRTSREHLHMVPSRPETESLSTAPELPLGTHRSTPDPAKAISAAIALGERSKALISSLSKPEPPASAAGQKTLSNQSSVATRMVLNVASATTKANPECSSPAASSSSSSSSDSDPDSKQLRAAFAYKPANEPRHPVNHPETHHFAYPRRVVSAGPTRVRHATLSTTAPSATTSTSAPAPASAAFVGTTNSLIRAQRSNSGQSLSESANLMFATYSGRPQNDMPAATETERDEESVVFAPPVQSSALRAQRSVSQLPQQQQQQDPTKKQPPKRLTVPKSPKFSVMSWQKKRGGSGPIRPSATAGTTTTAATTPSSTAAVKR